ncbi:Pre-mRNA-splicing factor SYF1 [Coelomomyces lativittatus]|nr:Pre-mRNA-splicing factor SYF1 [Coelomomyces lativittatus]
MKQVSEQPSNNTLVKDIDLRLLRLEKIMEERPFLVNEVKLRQNPHNAKEWLKRIALYQQHYPKKVESVFEEALKTIQPKQASGNLDEIWIAFAKHFSSENRLERAFEVFEDAISVPFKNIKELTNVWIAYAEMAVEHRDVSLALQLLGRATAIPANTNVDFFDKVCSIFTLFIFNSTIFMKFSMVFRIFMLHFIFLFFIFFYLFVVIAITFSEPFYFLLKS